MHIVYDSLVHQKDCSESASSFIPQLHGSWCKVSKVCGVNQLFQGSSELVASDRASVSCQYSGHIHCLVFLKRRPISCILLDFMDFKWNPMKQSGKTVPIFLHFC